MSISSEIRERFRSGETLNQSKIAGEFGCSSSMLGMVRKGMEDAGAEFESIIRVDGHRQFIDWRMLKDAEEIKVAKPEQEEPSKNGTAPLPVLGQTVTVTLLAVSEAGVVSIGLRDGKRTWLTQLSAQTE